MIIQTIDTESEFRDAFIKMGRADQFSYDATTALFHYLEEVYSDSNYELDVIALCCDYSEYTEDELMKEYNSDKDYDSFEELLDYLKDNTIVLDLDNGSYIIQAF